MSLIFSENDIIENANMLTGFDARHLPRINEKSPERTGKCATCGAKCFPYYTCKKCREITTVRNALNDLVDEGFLVRKTEGRGKKGGAIYAKKPVNPLVRVETKKKPNEPCFCGSGLKFKKCCVSELSLLTSYKRRESYFESATKRIKVNIQQTTLFEPVQAKQEQLTLESQL